MTECPLDARSWRSPRRAYPIPQLVDLVTYPETVFDPIDRVMSARVSSDAAGASDDLVRSPRAPPTADRVPAARDCIRTRCTITAAVVPLELSPDGRLQALLAILRISHAARAACSFCKVMVSCRVVRALSGPDRTSEEWHDECSGKRHAQGHETQPQSQDAHAPTADCQRARDGRRWRPDEE